MLNIIQPDIWLSLRTRPRAVATPPEVTAPDCQPRIATAPTPVIMNPLRTATAVRTSVSARVVRRVASTRKWKPSLTKRSSRRLESKSLTDKMLVKLSTTRPETTERASAERRPFSRIFGKRLRTIQT